MATVNLMLIPSTIITNPTPNSGPFFRGVVVSSTPTLEDAPVWESPVARNSRLQAHADAEAAVEQLRYEHTRQLRLL